MDLSGPWRVAESTEQLRTDFVAPAYPDDGWTVAEVPGHWRGAPGLENSDGPVLYRKRFSVSEYAGPRADRTPSRHFVIFDGIFYQASVWFDGEYLGDADGYFYPNAFEVTDLLDAQAGEHLLAVEVSCPPPTDRRAKRTLTGVFQHSPYIDPSWNPGGIWSRVHLEATGPARIVYLKVLCQEANPDRAVLALELEVDARSPSPASVRTTVTKIATEAPGQVVLERATDHSLSAGSNRLRWTVAVDTPELWWPRSLGAQPLYRVTVDVTTPAGSAPSDSRQLVTGLRQVRVHNFVASVNGERMFLKGVNCAPTRRDLANATAKEIERDVSLAAEAGFDLMRLDGHVARPELYAEADRRGILVWQDLPLKWGYSGVRRKAAEQARMAVRLLGHHPCIALWCAHDEPLREDPCEAGYAKRAGPLRSAAAAAKPDWETSLLDRSTRRALRSEDATRVAVGRSGLLPHPGGATDSHLYYGWYYGEASGLASFVARLPNAGRFIGAFGASSVPDSADFMEPRAWPDLDWKRLSAHHGLDLETFDERMPPSQFASFEEWRAASQRLQANLLRYQVEALRRLKYRPTGGFCVSMLADSQPCVSFALIDHDRVPKRAYRALRAACAPVIVTAARIKATYRPGERVRLDVHAISDLRQPVDRAALEVVARYPGGERRWRYEGSVAADSCVFVAKPSFELPRSTAPGRIVIELVLGWPGGRASNRYLSEVVE